MQSRSRILVIDDDPMFRNVIVSILRKDYLISVASDGKAGFEKAELHRPDLVIIDYNMPVWDGLRTLKAFRNDLRFKDIKTVFLTSDASKETVLATIQSGTDSYIIKTTFNKEEFLSKINDLLKPEVVRPVHIRSSKNSSNSSKPLTTIDTSGVSAAQFRKQAQQVLNSTKEKEAAESKKKSAQANAFCDESKMTSEEKGLNEEMLAFQETLRRQSEEQKALEEPLAQEQPSDPEIDIPAQGMIDEEELLAEAIDDWE